MHSPIRARWLKFRRGAIRNGPSRRSSSRVRRPGSTSAASSRAASRPPSTPASRTGAPASVRSAPASRVRRSPASSRRSRHSPSMVANRVERGRYLDWGALMRFSRRGAARGGVEAAALMIGTPSNKVLLREAGLLAGDGERADPNDLIIAVRGADAAGALRAALAMLAEKPGEGAEPLRRARSLRSALGVEPLANLALISVPGDFAAAEAHKALEAGLNALVVSDNVPIADEVGRKKRARERGLLLMGPDCGTALIGGTALGFANAVPRGDIGMVSASGTGLQEVSSLIARLGGGVSHGIGVCGRDLDERVRALGMLAALDMLDADLGTRTLVLISKPPAPAVAQRVLARIRQSTKRSVVCFLGESGGTLTDAAEAAMERRLAYSPPALPKQGGAVRGLYCGGTLASEAGFILRRANGPAGRRPSAHRPLPGAPPRPR